MKRSEEFSSGGSHLFKDVLVLVLGIGLLFNLFVVGLLRFFRRLRIVALSIRLAIRVRYLFEHLFGVLYHFGHHLVERAR